MDRPHWTKSVPWWLGWLFVGGFGVAGAFGSSVLPITFQLFGFTAGCAAMAVAACGTIVHFVNEHRINQNRLPLKLEPIHLIVIGLLIAAGGVGWQWYRGSHPASGAAGLSPLAVPAPSHYGIAWNFDDLTRNDVYFLGLSKSAGTEVRIGSFQASGKNVSDDFISCSSGSVRADSTGKQTPVSFYLRESNDRVPIDQASSIPPSAEFMITTANLGTLLPDNVSAGDQTTVSQFLETAGGFWFVFECDKGTYKRHFTPKDIRELVMRFENSIDFPSAKPQVTRRQQ